MVDYKEIKLIKDGTECVPFVPNKADKSVVDNLVLTKASKLELETAVEELTESIPRKVSELENDIPYISETDAINTYATKSELSSNINNLINTKASKMELESAVEELDTQIDKKQDKLIAGDNITITNNIISTRSKIEVPVGVIIQSSVSVEDERYVKCNGQSITNYDERLLSEENKPILYRLFNKKTKNFHQQLFTTDKDICKKKNPDITKLYRPIRKDFDTYGMDIKGYVQINENISMSYGKITSESGFYDGEFICYNHALQVLGVSNVVSYPVHVIEWIPYYNTFITIENMFSTSFKKVAYNKNLVVIANSSTAQYTDDLNKNPFTDLNDFTKPYSVYYFNGRFILTSQSYIAHSIDGKTWIKNSQTTTPIKNIAYGNNLFIGSSSDGLFWSQDTIVWEKINVELPNKNIYDVIFCQGIFIATSGDYLYYSTDGINWRVQPTDYTIMRLDYFNNTLMSVYYGNTSVYSTDLYTFHEIPCDNNDKLLCVGFDGDSFAFVNADCQIIRNYTGISLTHRFNTPQTKAQMLTDFIPHNYVQTLDGKYTIDYKTIANDTNSIIYSAADTDVSISDNGWLVNATDGKYLYFGQYDKTTAKWNATSLIYSANTNSRAGSTNNAIDMEFDFITPTTFVATRDIFYAYRTLIFRVADVNGNLNMYMAGYNSNGLKWRYSNKSTGIILKPNTKYHLHFKTTSFSTTSPYYTYTLTVTPFNIIGSSLLTNDAQTHQFQLAYLPYNYYSNNATNSMMSIYHADASAWTTGQMLDLRSLKISWSGTGKKVDTYALNKTTKTVIFKDGLYMPYLNDSYIRIK